MKKWGLKEEKRIYYVQPCMLTQTLYFDEVDRHRNLDCIHYDICLDTTAARNWTSFSCILCQMYTKDKKISNEDTKRLFNLSEKVGEDNELLQASY